MLARCVTIACVLLLGSALLAGWVCAPGGLISPAFAGNGKGNNGNGNGNGGSNGTKTNNGNGNGNGNGKNANGNNGAADSQPASAEPGPSIGDDFRGEGFAFRPDPSVADLPPASPTQKHDSPATEGWLHGKGGKNKSDEDWGEYLGLGHKFDLGFTKQQEPNGNAFGQEAVHGLGKLTKEEKEAVKDARKAAREDAKAAAKDAKDAAEQEAVGDPLSAASRPVRDDAHSPDLAILARAGTYETHDVLALDLSSAGIAGVRALGFEPGESVLAPPDSVLTKFTTPPGMDAIEALRLLRRELPAGQFHLNRLYRPYRLANKDGGDGSDEASAPAARGTGACSGDRCFGRSAIGWKEEFARCAKGVTIGVIDTDVDLRHPTFAGQNITQQNFLPAGRQQSPAWHGTGVLALLAGRPDTDTPGLVHDATFRVADIFFAGDDGQPVTDTVSLLKSLTWMEQADARLINMSFSGSRDDLIEARIGAMHAKGFVFTAAAGNEGPAAPPAFPAAYPEVIAVTAVGRDRHIYPFANQGSHVDVAAPGVHIWTAAPDGREAYRSGTSFAVPFATAVLAILRPDTRNAPKRNLLERVKTIGLGNPDQATTYGRGLLQAPSACANPPETAAIWAAAGARSR